MMTREQIQEHLSLTKRAVRSTAIELIAKSHIAALDEIDRLTAEVAAKEQSVCGCGICLAHNNMKCPKLEIAKGLTGETTQNYNTVIHTPQGNTTGNLLIPRKEVGCTFDE